MKQFRKVMSLVLAVLLILPVGIVSAEQTDTSNEKIVDESTYEIINGLMDEYTHVSCTEPVDTIRLALLQAQLEALGVEFLDEETVAEQYPGVVESLYAESTEDNTVSPRYSAPSAVNTTWTSTRVVVEHSDGNTYNIQRLVASPKNANSELRVSGTNTFTHSGVTWTVGSTNITSGTASSGLSTLASGSKSIYSLYSSHISGLTTSSVVTPTQTKYQWTNDTYVCYTFVRLDNLPDSTQLFSYLSNRCSTNITCTVTGVFKNASGTVLATGQQQKSMAYGFSPYSYMNSNSEIAGYKNREAGGSNYKLTIYNLSVTGAGGTVIINKIISAPDGIELWDGV